MAEKAPNSTLIFMLLAIGAAAAPAFAAGPTSAQERGAEAFLNALATANPQAVAQEMHPDELESLRSKLLTLLRAENMRSDSTYRSRLFGQGRALRDVEGMTAEKFYAALSDRLRMRARVYEKFEWLAAVPDGKKVYLVGRGVPPKENGSVKVMVMVALMQYGSQWRAAIPSEIEAQLDDLLEGRAAGAPPPAAGGATSSTSGAPSQPLAPGISEMLVKAETALLENRCLDYYDQYMSPNFNKATSRSARKTLINACTNDENTRETMITTLRIVQELKPRYDGGGSRAVYDVSGQGLPYERFVLERGNDMRWYIAE